MPILTQPATLHAGTESDANLPGGDEWRRRSRTLYRYLIRDMQDAREQRELLYPKTHSTHVLRPVPLVYRLAVEHASLYRRAPSRRWVNPETGEPYGGATAALIARVYEGARVNRCLLTAHRMAVACGNSVVVVWPVDAVKGVRLFAVPPHLCEVQLADALSDDEKDLAALWARLPTDRSGATGQVLYDVATMTPTEGYWSQEDDGGGKRGLWTEDGGNPAEQVPAVMVRRESPGVGEWWANAPEDLLAAQRAVIHDLTDIGQFARMQGYSQPVIKTDGGPVAALELGPETAVQLRPEDAFTFESPSPDLDGNQRQIERYAEIVMALNGGTPDSIMRSKGVTALAKMVERADREQERKDWEVEFRRVEQRLYGLIRRWVNSQRGNVLPPARVEVDYRDAWLPADPLHQAQARTLNYQHGTSSPVRDVAREQGLTLDEARAEVKQNRDDVAEFGIDLAAPMANIDEQGGGTQLGGA